MVLSAAAASSSRLGRGYGRGSSGLGRDGFGDLPSVDRNGDAGEVAGRGGEHEGGDPAEFRRVTDAAQRDGGFRLGPGPFGVAGGGEEFPVAVGQQSTRQ